MMKRLGYVWGILTMAALLLAACAREVVTATVAGETAPPRTVVVTATPSPSPSPTPPPPPPPKELAVCLNGEPDTLYLYGDSKFAATQHVMEALYDGPIDHRAYGYQPVILEKLPSIADGDAEIRLALVGEGERVVNAEGQVVELTEGTRIRPTDCYSEGCEIEYEGGTTWMDRMQVTFKLRDSPTWADGEPLTAADSEFAFEIASDPATPGYRSLTEHTEYYRALDERRVRWVGVPGFIDDTYFLNFFPPLPRHQLEGRAPAALMQANETRRAPLGWGPFVVEEWVRGDRLALAPNPNYFRSDEGLPNLDRVVFKFTSGAPEMAAHLLSGECDIATHDADFSDLMPLLVQADEREVLKVLSAPSEEWERLSFGIKPASDYRRADFFGDVRVRQAFAQCIDRQAIVNEVTYGQGVVPDSYLPPGHPLYPEDDLTHWSYDPVAGRALLEEIGWLDEDGDGVREARNVDGVRSATSFEVTLLIPSDSPHSAKSREVARIVRANLMDCGIRVEITPLPSSELLAEGPEGPLLGRRFDLAETTQRASLVPECEHYLASEIPERDDWRGSNFSGYSNPDYDAACRAALRALPGTDAYEMNHRLAQVIFSSDLPAVPLFVWPRTAIARPGVLNLTMDATAPSELWNIETLDLQQDEPDG